MVLYIIPFILKDDNKLDMPTPTRLLPLSDPLSELDNPLIQEPTEKPSVEFGSEVKEQEDSIYKGISITDISQLDLYGGGTDPEQAQTRADSFSSMRKKASDDLKQKFYDKINKVVKGGGLTEFDAYKGILNIAVGDELGELVKKADKMTGGIYNIEQKITEEISKLGQRMSGSEEKVSDLVEATASYIGKLAEKYLVPVFFNSDIIISELEEVSGGMGTSLEYLEGIAGTISKTNAYGQDAFDIMDTLRAGFNMLNPISEDDYRPDLVGRLGSDLTKSIRDQMTENGVNAEDIEELINVMDSNNDKIIDSNELGRASNRKDVLQVIAKMDAATQMMVKNPVFRSQVIKRQTRQSIYGDDPYAKYNQVSMVQQSMAGDVEQANLFNTTYGAE